MADIVAGTGFGKFGSRIRSMRLSNRSILLAIGIVVAIVVTLTTLVYKDRAAAEKRDIRTPKKTSMLKTTAHRMIEFLSRQVTYR